DVDNRRRRWRRARREWPRSRTAEQRDERAASCVDGPRLARDHLASQARRAMKTAAMIFALALVGSQALAQEQTRIYGPDGRSLGTAAPYGTGSVRYRDSRGRTTFTTTTMNGVTRFYDSGGHLTGTVIGSRRADGGVMRAGYWSVRWFCNDR